jgi:hypothetical protein
MTLVVLVSYVVLEERKWLRDLVYMSVWVAQDVALNVANQSPPVESRYEPLQRDRRSTHCNEPTEEVQPI